MPLVKFKHALSGTDAGWAVGDVADRPADEAARLIAADFAELVEGETLDAPSAKPARGGRRGKSQPAASPAVEPPADPPAA